MAQREGAAAASPLPTLKQVKERRAARQNVNDQHDASLSLLERSALWITDHVGTMGFFIIIVVWTLLWMGWNIVASRLHLPGVFDKPFEFLIWLFVSNLLQIMLMPLIMVGQNLQARHAEMRADQEFDTTVQTEYEMEVVLQYLQLIHETLSDLEERVAAIEKKAGREA